MRSNSNATKTLTFRLWGYFITFAILIFIVLWFMQVIFLQSYYSSMKKSEIIKISDEIEEEYFKGNYSDKIDKIAYKNATYVFLFDTKGNIKYTSAGESVNGLNIQSINRPISFNIDEIIKKMISSPNGKMSYTLKLDRFKTEIFVYGRILEDKDTCLVMVTSIDPIDSTTNVLKSQLVYVTIIALIISSVVSIFLSRRISHPLQEMTKTAKKLAKGNYEVNFEKSDYVEIDELADTLNYTTKKLKETDEVRKELIANVSHDLKTPLTMIKAYSEMIRDLSGENKEKREEHLNVIIEETDRLTRLVTDMMDLSKIESGFTTLTKVDFNLSEVVKKIVSGFDIIQDENCSIKVDMPNEAFVLADKTKIEQVVYNLVANAINHSGEKKDIRIKIVSAGKRYKFLVEDNGPGIKKEDLPNIWNRYYKTSDTYKRANSGSGLGLSIVKNILNKHNSNFGADSVVGKGTIFYFDLEKGSKKEIKK